MKRVGIFFSVIVIIFSLVCTSWYVLHNELNFFTDVAGEFLLLKEIQEKGIILIGRHSSGGLFHGPLWAYLNYPAYFIGNGNPLIVEWYWIVLIAISTILNYFIAKRLFSSVGTGLVFAMLYSLYWVVYAKVFIHPYSALFIFPLYFYLFVKYFETSKIKYLLWHVVLIGLLIQSDLAIGIPFALLSFFAIVYKALKIRKLFHLTAFFLLGIMLINFIVFNIRHKFIYLQYITKFLSNTVSESPYTYEFLIRDKLKWMWVSIDTVRIVPEQVNFLVMFLLLIFIIDQIKNNRFKSVYMSYLYFYCGYFILSFTNRGPLLKWYMVPLYLLTFLMVSSFITAKKAKIIAVAFLVVVIIINMKAAYLETLSLSEFSRSSEDSWKSLNIITSKVFSGREKEFGYFIYSPDALGYEPKYAMHFQEKIHQNKNAHYFTKKAVTYLIIVPRPKNNPYMKHEWWRENQVNIKRKPDQIFTFPNEYTIEKYYLSSDEQKIPWSPEIDTGFHFR